RNGELNSALAAKVNISDTAAMLSPYALTSELDEFGSGSGDVIGADTITATRIALWSGQDSLTGDSRLIFSSTGLGALTYTGNSIAFNSSIIDFGTSSSGTGVIRGVATNSPAIINRTPTATNPNIVIHKNWSTTGIGGTYGSGTSSLALIVSNATKFQTFDTYNNSVVPLYTPASTSSLSGFRLPHGTAPSSPVNGDLWTTTGGLFVQVNSSTDTLATQEYARQYGGTGTVTLDNVQDEIADSLNVLRAAVTVGNGTKAPFFDGTQDGGQILYFYGDNGFYTALQGGAPTANRSYRLPIAALPSAGTTSLLNIDEYGNMGFVASTTYAPTANPTFTGVQKVSTTDTLATKAYARSVGGGGTGSIDSLILNGGSLTLTGDDKLTFETNGIASYSLPAGGGNLTIMSQVQDWINDSIDARIGAGVELSDIAIMIADSTGNAVGNYVTRKALIDSIAAAGTGTGVSITDVRDEIADSLNAIRSASVQGVALSDSTDLYVTITRLRDSLLVVRDSINVLRSEIDDLWLAFANLGTGDVTAPYVESAELGTYNDSIIVVLMSATDVQQDSVPPVSAFTVYEDAVEMGIADISINYDTVFIALDSIGVFGAGYTLDYTRAYPMLQDSTGNRTQNFTAEAITNNVEEITAGPENMVTNGTFSTADYWTLGHANSGQGLSITGGHLAFTDLVANDDSYADQAQADMVTGLESGVNYTLEFDITMVGTGLSLVRFYTNGGGAGITPYGVERGTGHYSINFTAPTISTGGLHIGNFANGSQGWYIDNVVVYLQE
ncbi:MAG TPA: hypothetical protein PL124_11430, partial [Candidatus Cloacimonadota bacterium]|nr:hypothetical protein [Candidatus Cloacimonadota bacterium]